MPLTSFLHRKSNAIPLPLPLPPLDPPPPVEKRQEKEKAWLASIYDRKGKSTPSSKKSENKDARGLGYTHAPAGQRNHARSKTADSAYSITATESVGKSSASVRSGLLTISSRWGKTSSRPASVINEKTDDILQPNIATLQVPHSSTSSANRAANATTSSSSTSSPTLAQRLDQLSQAHSQGLLDDEEYRVLRGNLFENSLKKPSLSPSDALPIAQNRGQSHSETHGRQNDVRTTGTLLGLPRLVQNQSPVLGTPRYAALQDPANVSSSSNGLTVPRHSLEQQHLLHPLPTSAESTRSVRTRSKLSVRSSKSALSLRSRITSLLPSSSKQEHSTSKEIIDSTTASSSGTEDGHMLAQTTLGRKPSFMDSARSALTFKPAAILHEQTSNSRANIPTEWTTASGTETMPATIAPSSPLSASRRSSHLSASGISTSSASSSFNNVFQQTQPRTSMSKAGSSLLLDEKNGMDAEYLKTSLGNPAGVSRRSISEDHANHSLFPTLAPLQFRQRPRSSTLLSSSTTPTQLNHPSSPTSSSTHDPQHLGFSVMQPEDESLDAEGLRKAIQKVKLEKKNVSEQFAQLEGDLLANLGRSANTSSSMSCSPRRPGASGQRSLGSSSSSSIQAGDSTFRQSLNFPSGPLATLSRRPSLANSVRSHGSTSSSLLSPSSISRKRHSHTMQDVEDEELVLALASSHTSKGRHGLEGLSDSTESMSMREEGDDKLQRLQEKRRNVEMRYDARLEYLHAKLVARELKEKLRR